MQIEKINVEKMANLRKDNRDREEETIIAFYANRKRKALNLFERTLKLTLLVRYLRL